MQTEKRSPYLGAKRMDDIRPSTIRSIMERTACLKKQGADVVDLSVGEPDFNTPEPIKRATIQAIANNHSHYVSNRGVLDLRKAIAEMLLREYGLHYNPETEILVTTGGAEAINNAIMANVGENDEVIIPEPAFVNYKYVTVEAGAVPVLIPLSPESGFQLDIAQIEAAITPRTRMIVLNNPNNPTGAVYPQKTLTEISDLACKHNLLVLADEMYSKILYGKSGFVSISSISGMRDRAIVINGFSKTYAMTGWRLGYLYADERLINNIVRIHQYSTTNTAAFIQVGVAESMNTPETSAAVQEMVEEFAHRRELFLSELSKVPLLKCIAPLGSFFIVVDTSGTGLDGTEFSRRLLEEKFVSAVPVIGLGGNTANWIRCSFAVSDQKIVEGIRRIRELVAEVSGK